jgi:hypothetical protein
VKYLEKWLAAFMVLLIITFVFFLVCAIRATNKEIAVQTDQWQHRRDVAASWSGDSAQFVTTGDRDTNLYVALPHYGYAACDAYIDSVIHDKKVSAELKGLGFDSIQCLDRKETLR